MRGDQVSRAAPEIHPTASVHPTASLGAGVRVGPYAVIGPSAVIGDDTIVGAHAVIDGDVTIGRRNQLGAGVVLGAIPQHRQYRGERSLVRVGDGNVFGEYATVSRGFGEGTATEIGGDNYLMSYVRVDHNCRIGNSVTVTSGAGLGGFVVVEDQAYVGGNGGVHQFVRIGRLSIVGAVAMVRQDVPPFVMAAGVPARAYGVNMIGLRRAGIPPAQRAALKRAFVLLYRSGLTVTRASARMQAELGSDPLVAHLIAFLREGRAGRGIIRWSRETPSV